MTQRSLIRLLAVGALLALLAHGVAPQAVAADSEIDSYVRSLETSYRGVNTLRADFTQTRKWGNRIRTESGTVMLERGGQMRWDYVEPSPKLFVTSGKDLYLYVPADNQVTHSKVKASDDVRVPFRLLLSRLNLRKIFGEITFAPGAIDARPGNRVLRGVPRKAEETGYSEVLMEISPEFDIRTLVITYADRSRMEFVFDSISRNVPLSPSLFSFTPPAGVEVIEQK
jgi:outer membrane lipoprotein carrier protein